MHPPKDEVAKTLAQAHYTVEPGIRVIARILEEDDRNEEAPDNPIKLLEANEDTTAEGIIPIFFRPDAPSGILYPSVVIEVTPVEYEQIREGELSLPNGWRLGDVIRRQTEEAVD